MKAPFFRPWSRIRRVPWGTEGIVTTTTIDAAALKGRIEGIVARLRADLDDLEDELKEEGGTSSNRNDGKIL